MIDRDKPKCEPSHFKQFILLSAVSDLYNSFPILLLEYTVIPHVESRTLILSYRRVNQLFCTVISLVKKELHFTGTSIISILNQFLNSHLVKN